MTRRGSFSAILLAAGAGRRFGADKLAATIDGEAIIARSATRLAQTECLRRIAVLSAATATHADTLRALSYTIVVNQQADEGLSTSIRVGLEAARKEEPDGVLIALADMPFVETTHLDRLIATSRNRPDGLAFSTADKARTPPAAFGREWFDALALLSGDGGAREILREAAAEAGVEAAPGTLRDIDRPDDLLS